MQTGLLWYTILMSDNSLNELKKEVQMLRSFAISMVGKDDEGTYKPEFVRELLRSARVRPTRRFTGAKDFLADLEAA